jgi:hypothetical protein
MHMVRTPEVAFNKRAGKAALERSTRTQYATRTTTATNTKSQHSTLVGEKNLMVGGIMGDNTWREGTRGTQAVGRKRAT